MCIICGLDICMGCFFFFYFYCKKESLSGVCRSFFRSVRDTFFSLFLRRASSQGLASGIYDPCNERKRTKQRRASEGGEEIRHHGRVAIRTRESLQIHTKITHDDGFGGVDEQIDQISRSRFFSGTRKATSLKERKEEGEKANRQTDGVVVYPPGLTAACSYNGTGGGKGSWPCSGRTRGKREGERTVIIP